MQASINSEQKSSEDAPSARRCLILANPEAGAIKKWSQRHRFWQRFAFWERLVRWNEKQNEKRFRRETGKKRSTTRTLSTDLAEAEAADNPLLPPFLAELTAAAAEVGLETEVEAAPAPAQLRERVQQAEAEGFHVIVAVGGDGTVRTVAQALIESPLILGILPLGTANNIARGLGIPFTLPEAMQTLRDGIVRDMDAGRIGEEYFLEAAGVGLFADAMHDFGAEEPRPYQVFRLLKVLWPLFWNLRSRTLRLILDGVEHQEEVTMVTVANGAYLGEGLAVAPNASVSDGRFDVLTVGRLSRPALLRFALALLRRQHLALPQVHLASARQVEIRRIHLAHRPLPVHADDHIAARTPATLTVLPNALRVIAPSLP